MKGIKGKKVNEFDQLTVLCLDEDCMPEMFERQNMPAHFSL